MTLHSVKYLTVEGAKSAWHNRLMSIASIGVLFACMLIIGFAVLISENLDSKMKDLEQENVVMAFFKDDLDEPTTAARIQEIKELPNVLEVKYISPAEGMELMLEELGQDYAPLFTIFEGTDGMILPPSAQIKFNDVSQYDQTLAKVQAVPDVVRVNSRRDVAQKIVGWRNTINIASYGIIAMLMIIALVIICNTIRITMYSRKREISIMKAVGATNGFVRLPFIVEGMLIGIIAGGLSIAALKLLYQPLANMLDSTLTILPFGQFLWPLLGLFMGIGVLSGLISSFLMIGKYLRKEGSEFNAF